MTNEKLWGGRFNAATAKQLEAYHASIHFDCELALEDILGSLAHVSMLNHCQIINAEDFQLIQQGLKNIAQEIATGTLDFRIEDEDIHMNIERLLASKIGGEAAGKLHTARSRNDQVAVDVHLYLRRKIVLLIDAITQLQTILIALAKRNVDVIMPGYTHMQRAQPIYFAQHLQAYCAMLQRDIERLRTLFQAINISPLGACALNGTTFKIDPLYTAKLLGFDDVYINTIDAVSNRDFVIDFLAAASISMMHISRLSEELILWSAQEFDFITFDDAYCTGSSIMPQKKNPDIPELARGKTGRVYGALFALLTTLKGLPLAYNKDLQEDKEPLFDAMNTWQNTLNIMTFLMSAITINSANMSLATEKGFLNATAIAEYLVQKGSNFRAAHEAVGRLVAYCHAKNITLGDLTLAEFKDFAPLAEEDVKDVMKTNVVLKNAATQVSHAFNYFAHKLQENNQWISEQQKKQLSVYQQFDLQEIF